MQAQYEHSPPTSSDSTMAAVSPFLTARSAMFSPAGPAPITIRSYSLVTDMCLPGSCLPNLPSPLSSISAAGCDELGR